MKVDTNFASDDESARRLRRARAQQIVSRHAAHQRQTPPPIAKQVSRYNILVELASGRRILFNSHTRNMAVLTAVEAQLYDGLADGQVPNSDEALRFAHQLAQDGYLLDPAFDQLAAIKGDYDAVRYDAGSLSLTIAPTMACNLACGYCYQGLDKDLNKIRKGVPEKTFDLVKAQIGQLHSVSVTWYGGEPLMGKDVIFRLSDRLIGLCDRKGVDYSASIVTNGVHLTTDIALQLYSRRCTMAQVTIDGTRDIHDKMRPTLSGRGSYDEIIANLRDVVTETPMHISLRVNVGAPNLDDAGKLLDEITAMGLGETGQLSLYFAPLEASTQASGTAFEESLTKAEFNQALVRLKERAIENGLDGIMAPPSSFLGMCVAAKQNGYVVAPNGDLHKCWETAHDPRKRVGTLDAPEEFEATPNGKLWKEWTPFDNPVCRGCKILPMCGGMCGHRFVYHGEGDENALPCPDWKWNTAEYLFSRAKFLGHVTDDEWLESEASVNRQQAGDRHSSESLAGAQQRVLDRVNANGDGPQLTRDYILNADGRFFETPKAPAIRDR